VVLASVFIPISMIPSTAGRLFREFGVVLAVAVVISSFVALSLVPALTAWLLRHEKPPGPWSPGCDASANAWPTCTCAC